MVYPDLSTTCSDFTESEIEAHVPVTKRASALSAEAGNGGVDCSIIFLA